MDRTELVLGRGELYFDRFIPGTRTGEGERYIGNTQSLLIERRLDFAEAKRSSGGVLKRHFRTPTSDTAVVTFTTDHISLENMADWFGGAAQTDTIAGSFATENVTLKAGRFYQVGLSIFPAIGARNINSLIVKVGTVTITGLEVDYANGRFGVPSDRTDLDGETASVSFEYKPTAASRITNRSTPIRGSLRFIARNPHGRNTNYFFPHILLSPRDQLNLKGDEWQTLTFDGDALADWIAYDAGISGRSTAEDAISDEGMTFSEFIVAEDLLDHTVNTIMPARGY